MVSHCDWRMRDGILAVRGVAVAPKTCVLAKGSCSRMTSSSAEEAVPKHYYQQINNMKKLHKNANKNT